jgi:outer membrane biosynthesis protein TonB
MDRDEILGFGSALIGHVLLALALIYGLFFFIEKPVELTPVVVSLVGEEAPVSSAPDPVAEEEEAAPPAAFPQEIEEPVPAPEPEGIERPEPRPVVVPEKRAIALPTPQPKQTIKPVVKPATKPVTKPSVTTKAKPATVAGKGTRTSQGSPFSRQFEDAISGAGKNGTKPSVSTGAGKASGTAATQSAAQVRSAVTVSLRAEIQPFFKKCLIGGTDTELLVTPATLNIAKNGSLVSVSLGQTSGINDSNRTQAGLHRDCVTKAARAASPFLNLPADGYDVWKSWAMVFKTR